MVVFMGWQTVRSLNHLPEDKVDELANKIWPVFNDHVEGSNYKRFCKELIKHEKSVETNLFYKTLDETVTSFYMVIYFEIEIDEKKYIVSNILSLLADSDRGGFASLKYLLLDVTKKCIKASLFNQNYYCLDVVYSPVIYRYIKEMGFKGKSGKALFEDPGFCSLAKSYCEQEGIVVSSDFESATQGDSIKFKPDEIDRFKASKNPYVVDFVNKTGLQSGVLMLSEYSVYALLSLVWYIFTGFLKRFIVKPISKLIK
jgi:hypothetical protein